VAGHVFPAAHGRAHGRSFGCFLTGTVAHREPMLEQCFPEELQPMEKTHSAADIQLCSPWRTPCT